MEDLKSLLEYINPAQCSYQEWVNVGMALKHEGYPVEVWENWSAKDTKRYHYGECARKWRSFQESTSEIVTGGTIYQLAEQFGYTPDEGRELSWDDEIEYQKGVVVSPGWVEGREIREPAEWHPGKEAARYIETLFEPGEVIGINMQSRLDEERQKYIPVSKGIYNLTAGEILEKISKHGDDIGAALGDYDPKAGAWIRFNPLDGDGVRNTNVTEYRYALVESDELEIEKQNQIIRELELPVAVLMYSGGKSIHAIVRIDAADYREYQKRVEYLYKICEKNGIPVDTQNKNPSRLSRLPGCERGGRKQFIIDTNIGKSSWEEWHEWIEAVNDNLPDIEDLSEAWDNIPELAGELIAGVLRKGHKMLIAGPSKAGKSFLQIELCIAIAEGLTWLGRKCAKGRVMYVNLELDRASCLHRFRDVYRAFGMRPTALQNIDIWNLRGKAVPMDQLTPKLIRRAQKRDYAAIIIDPIYKVITGDENSAEQMARFCNQFDKICAELKCAAIYCHHHSKGAQGGKKSMDRASGSGVFARDPDAQLDMIELPLADALKEQHLNRAMCDWARKENYLTLADEAYRDHLSEDDLLVWQKVNAFIENSLDEQVRKKIPGIWEDRRRYVKERDAALASLRASTAWRLEATLREFPAFDPINVWFEYPIHRIDDTGALSDVDPESEKSAYEKMVDARKSKVKQEKADNLNALIAAFEGLEENGTALVIEIAEEIGVSPDTIKRWFGNGNRSRKDYKKLFESYEDPDSKKLCLRRKREQGQ